MCVKPLAADTSSNLYPSPLLPFWGGRSEQQQQQHNNREETPAARQSASERLQQQLDGGTFIDVEALLSHWQDLDDARKLQYAQMAALTR